MSPGFQPLHEQGWRFWESSNVRHSYNLASNQVAHGVITAYYEKKNQTCDRFAALFISGFVLAIRYKKSLLYTKSIWCNEEKKNLYNFNVSEYFMLILFYFFVAGGGKYGNCILTSFGPKIKCSDTPRKMTNEAKSSILGKERWAGAHFRGQSVKI